MYKTDHIAAYDQQVVADLKAKQAYINESGRAAGLRIGDGGKLPYEQGYLRVPEGPGLSVEFDLDRLE